MDKFEFIDELLSMVKSGELKATAGKSDSIKMLEDIRLLVMESLHNEIVKDITDARTGYYAPEFNSWIEFLAYCNGYADYEKVLQASFSQKILDVLWQNSHIAEELSEQEIKDRLILEIEQLKKLQIVNEDVIHNNPILLMNTGEAIKAKILGLYNLLYEE